MLEFHRLTCHWERERDTAGHMTLSLSLILSSHFFLFQSSLGLYFFQYLDDIQKKSRGWTDGSAVWVTLALQRIRTPTLDSSQLPVTPVPGASNALLSLNTWNACMHILTPPSHMRELGRETQRKTERHTERQKDREWVGAETHRDKQIINLFVFCIIALNLQINLERINKLAIPNLQLCEPHILSLFLESLIF